MDMSPKHPGMSIRVLVLDGSSRAALAVARALGAQGMRVYVGSDSRTARAFFSKYCAGRVVHASPVTKAGPFRDDIQRACQTFGIDVIFPIYSNTIRALRQTGAFPGTGARLIPLIDPATYDLVDDKGRLMRLAAEIGIPTPRTWFPASADQLSAEASGYAYPVLLKPRVSAGGFGILYARDPSQLLEGAKRLEGFRRVSLDHEPFESTLPVVQEFIPGRSITAQAYCEKGVVLALYVSESLRRHPTPFGPSVAYRAVDPMLVKEPVERFVKHFNWTGPVILAFMIDPRDGTAKLIEVNPRVGGTIESAVDAGIDIPGSLVRRACGMETPVLGPYRVGRRFRWTLFGEGFWLLQGRPTWSQLRDFLDLTDTGWDVDWRDLKPHGVHLWRLIRKREVR